MAVCLPANSGRAASGAGLLLLAAAGLAASALYVRQESRRAEREYPRTGKSVTVRGVRLHFIDTGGADPVLVLLHGNGAMIADMEISGLVNEAAKRYRVIVFDRPGYGYSERPRDQSVGTQRTGRSIPSCFRSARLRPSSGIRALVGHTDSGDPRSRSPRQRGWSCARVGVLLPDCARRPAPGRSGDHALSRRPPTPHHLAVDRAGHGSGDVPQDVCPATCAAAILRGVPDRPYAAPLSIEGQLGGNCDDGADGGGIGRALLRSRVPVCIMAGGEDRIVDTGRQSARLHGVIGQSELRVLPGLGHMLHYFATDQVVRAIDAVAKRAEVPVAA